MADLITTILGCGWGSDGNIVVNAQGPEFTHSFQLTQQAADRLIRELLMQPHQPAQWTPGNVSVPEGCEVFESESGISGLAFHLRGRVLPIGIPRDQIAAVRQDA